ncbi:MAG: hypothetical protein QJ16_C0023G0018 [archaeon GW2011_AR1]|nr:MAG: hypothetical protein QJ16_C0023G0018 [archaeon GW2011_AR1]
MGLWGSLVALEVWDLSTPVQIRAAPFKKMTTKSKKTKSAGRFGARYGKTVRDKLVQVEKKQRVKQKCPFCEKIGLKRISKGVWNCPRCEKTFASNVYYLE